MKLVIAEKPSVAQSLAAVIGATARKDGYLEGGGWRVSWCVGHLAGLADADAYNPDYAKWRYDDLPILPEPWQMVVSKDKKKQFDVLKQLMNAPDVTEVVNACDAGREGELIFRSVYELAGCQKPMKRLWISSMEDSAIREGFANLRPGADYDGLRDAALCRAKADWLVGINATRLFSVLYHRTLNIGRVMSPTPALSVQRDAEIDTIKPVPFYTVTLELPGFTVSGERMADKAAAQQLKTACQGAAATVKKVGRKNKSEKPPALYDLTTLNDILYLSGGGDIEFNQHNDGNHNGSLYYSIPFGYWTLSAYGAYSQYRQQFNGNWSTMDYKSKNRYYSATLSRLLSHTRQQKTTADLRIAKSTSHYYFGGSELLVMRKQNPSWEFTLNRSEERRVGKECRSRWSPYH